MDAGINELGIVFVEKWLAIGMIEARKEKIKESYAR
jgi:hypothetical protein